MAAPITWFELAVHDFERAKAFYGRLLGWEFAALDGYDEEYWVAVTGSSEGIRGGLTRATDRRQPGGGGVVYAQVDDLDAALSAAVELGSSVVQPLRLITAEDGRFAVVTDPDGNHLGLFQA